MAIPFYENEEELQQQQVSEEIDQVDGPVIHSPNLAHNHLGLNSSIPVHTSHPVNQVSVNQQDLMAWKILALAMCKALKDHYQQNMANTIPAANVSSSAAESATAVIQILPNGQVKPQWN